jgi:hypothetical protein
MDFGKCQQMQSLDDLINKESVKEKSLIGD